MNQAQPLLWSDCFSLAGAGGAWSNPNLTSLDRSILPAVRNYQSRDMEINVTNTCKQTSQSDDDFSGRSLTASPVSNQQLSDMSFDRANQYGSWDIESPVMRNSKLSYDDIHLPRKSRRQAPSPDTRRAQNRAAQRAYRQRAALHLKAVEEELASLKQKYGNLMQRYDELNCWSNGLLRALLEKDPTWEAASGIIASGV